MSNMSGMTFFVLALLFFVPLALHSLLTSLNAIFPPKEKPTIYIDIVPEYTLEDIKRNAMERAANGDASARKWVMENIFNKQKTSTTGPGPKSKSLTDQSIVNDAISALVSLGTKKKDATDKIESLVAAKKYISVHQLLNEAFKK